MANEKRQHVLHPVDPAQYRRCTGKRRHESKRQAQRAALDRPLKLYTYRCRDCKGWHLTRSRPWGALGADDVADMPDGEPVADP